MTFLTEFEKRDLAVKNFLSLVTGWKIYGLPGYRTFYWKVSV